MKQMEKRTTMGSHNGGACDLAFRCHTSLPSVFNSDSTSRLPATFGSPPPPPLPAVEVVPLPPHNLHP
jgi:hypothetical protein